MAKYILSGDARDIPLAASMLLAQEQMFEHYIKRIAAGGSTDRKELPPKRKGKLRIQINFIEPEEEADPDFYPVPGEISFRLMQDDPKTVSLERLQVIASKIKEKFNNFVWKKGKTMCSYTDWDRGYQLQILAIDENEGKRICDQVLEVQGHSFEGECFNFNKNWSPTTRFPILPDKSLIAGELVREDRQRPIANVKLFTAEVYFPRIRRGITILDENFNIFQKLTVPTKAG